MLWKKGDPTGQCPASAKGGLSPLSRSPLYPLVSARTRVCTGYMNLEEQLPRTAPLTQGHRVSVWTEPGDSLLILTGKKVIKNQKSFLTHHLPPLTAFSADSWEDI